MRCSSITLIFIGELIARGVSMKSSKLYRWSLFITHIPVKKQKQLELYCLAVTVFGVWSCLIDGAHRHACHRDRKLMY